MNIRKTFFCVLTYMHDIAHPVRNAEKHTTLPVRIGPYRFERQLRSTRDYPFAVGVYTYKPRQRFVIKVWKGNRKDVHYYELKHEATVNSLLTEIEKRAVQTHHNKFQAVRIIPFADLIEKNGTLALVRPYIAGVPLTSWTSKQGKTAHYDACVAYMRFLGNNCTNSEAKMISQKSVKNFLPLYPFILVVAIIKHPKLIGALLQGIPFVVSGSMSLFSARSNTLVHGDLQTNNVLVYRGIKYIFDVEQTMFTYPEYELITTIANKKNTDDFVQFLITKVGKYHKNQNFHSWKGLLVFCLTYNLTGDALTSSTERYIHLLRWAVKQSPKQIWRNAPAFL